MNVSSGIKDLVLQLHQIEAVKFGSFKLRSGMISPIYIDLRVCVSYPKVLSLVGDMMYEELQKAKATYDLVCGVPYTALPIATAIAVKNDIPMVVRRKEAKNYGTRKIIEGHYKKGQTCLVIEDLVTTGGSVCETVVELVKEGLVVRDVAVLVDREQGARADLLAKGFTLHSVLTITQLVDILHSSNILDKAMVNTIHDFLKNNTIAPQAVVKVEKLPFSERSKSCKNPIATKLYDIMQEKKSNLAVAVDLKSKSSILDLASQVGDHICLLKTHADIIEDFDDDFVAKLRELAAKHKFLIFEDRKFADIGSVAQSQLTGGIHRISSWANIVTVHAVAGAASVDALKEKGVAVLLIAEMSSEGTLATGDYTQAVLQIGEKYKDTVIGFISTKRFDPVDASLLFCTPGVQFNEKGDGLGQQYQAPSDVVGTKFSDVIIVGRGIYLSQDPKAEAIKYQQAAWASYLERTSQK